MSNISIVECMNIEIPSK